MKKLIFIGAGIICLIIIVVACSRNKKETTPAHTKNGKILIVEYGDYKCPYCKKIEDNVMPIIKKIILIQIEWNINLLMQVFLEKIH